MNPSDPKAEHVTTWASDQFCAGGPARDASCAVNMVYSFTRQACVLRSYLNSCCTNKVMSRPAMGMDLILLPMTYPSATGITCVTPSPLSTTVPVNAAPFLCMASSHIQRHYAITNTDIVMHTLLDIIAGFSLNRCAEQLAIASRQS